MWLLQADEDLFGIPSLSQGFRFIPLKKLYLCFTSFAVVVAKFLWVKPMLGSFLA